MHKLKVKQPRARLSPVFSRTLNHNKHKIKNMNIKSSIYRNRPLFPPAFFKRNSASCRLIRE